MTDIDDPIIINYLDEIVAKNKNLISLTRDSAESFLDETTRFIGKYGNSVDYFRRGIQINPTLNPTLWKNEGKLFLLGANFDLDDIYIQYKNRLQNTDDLYVNLHTRGTSAGYIFVPEVGLYLHTKDDNYATDHLLLSLNKVR
jgi:hypothetical protein